MRFRFIYVLLTVALTHVSPPFSQAGSSGSPKKAVLVTGASSGIGRVTTERLAAAGYFVYAGARKGSDVQELDAINNVKGLRLDVTQPSDIAAAVEAITRSGRGLYGVVNNAGISVEGGTVDSRQEDFDLVMSVNVAGTVQITRAFAPLVAANKGRIVNVGSIMGILSTKDLTAYCMSKHAIESFTDSLAEEMAPRGVYVSIVEPGTYRTKINHNSFARQGKDVPNSIMAAEANLKPPDEVAAAIQLALSEAQPKRRYLLVPEENQHEAVLRKQIEQLVQLNEGQPYSYERDVLVKMLDQALETSRSRSTSRLGD